MSEKAVFESIRQSLYSSEPGRPLYHYTGYQALLGIAQTAELWGSDIHYFNDSSELKHAARVFRSALASVARDSTYPTDLVEQLHEWLDRRLADGHALFVVCFTEAGNLLSQWRGYTPHGNGLSLGFDPGHLGECASAQGFQIGQCIYSRDQQEAIGGKVVKGLLNFAVATGPKGEDEAHPSQSYHENFSSLEIELLSIAALLKNPAFEAEQEWRAVSAVHSNYVEYPAKYRVGRNMLIPYKPFSIRQRPGESIRLEHVYLGPTPENNLAMSSLSKFLACHGMNPKGGVTASQLPYRAT